MNSAELKAAVGMLKAVAESVREAGAAGIGAGVLFAALQTQGCSLKAYQQIERGMVDAGLVRKDNDRLGWVG